MILYELIVGKSAFPMDLTGSEIVRRLLNDEWRPDIPTRVAPFVADLIADCWAQDPDNRPSFCEIVERLEAIHFRVFPEVNPAKIERFVRGVRALEDV
jgi:hypothetical protein